MASNIPSHAKLNNGVMKPWVAFGCYRTGAETLNAVKAALQVGYRSIDNASVYENEEQVGVAIKESGVPREELFITTKVWNSEQGYDSTLAAFDASRKRLGLEYIDMYLIHWAVPDKWMETWKALERLYADGVVKAIGVSNFQIHHLERLMSESDIVPAVNQVELHPLNTQKELLQFCHRHNILVEAWRPLMNGKLDLPQLQSLSAKYGKSPAQIVLRWHLQNGVASIAKSVHPERIRENYSIFDFEIEPEDMALIDSMNIDKRFGPHPDRVNF